MSDVNPCISEDIWFKILKELPVKILGKCRCVCKSWHSLIVSSYFMAAHLKHYTQNESNSLLLYKEMTNCPSPRLYEQCVFFRDLAQLNDGNSSLHTSVFPFMLCVTFYPHFKFVGSIHGLLCLCDASYSSRILLWNPLLQKSIKLPVSTSADRSCELAFGYDSRKNDYRVVKISHLDDNDESSTTLLIEIYSVQERTWREISGDYLGRNDIDYVSNRRCFLNGVIYWLTLEAITEFNNCLAKWLLLFDVSEETFEKMELPESFLTKIVGEFGVFEYKNRLSVSHCEYAYDSMDDFVGFASCQMWVKEEYNVWSSWCKILKVELHDCVFSGPIQYLGRNEELLGFAKRHTKELVAYDPKTMQTKGLGRRPSSSTTFSAYSESLVLLDQNLDTVTDDDFTDEELQRSVEFIDCFNKLNTMDGFKELIDLDRAAEFAKFLNTIPED